MSNLLFIKCSTIQNIIQTMVTYDSVDRLKFLSTMQVLEMAKNNIVIVNVNTGIDNYHGGDSISEIFSNSYSS